MSQNNELDKVKARIKALASKTTDSGCTEAEAMNAAIKVGKLLEQYNLEMSEVDVREQKCIKVNFFMGTKKRNAMDSCVVSLARFTDCRAWIQSGHNNWVNSKVQRGEISVVFFGHEQDIDCVRYLFRLIYGALEHETDLYKKSADYRAAGAKKSAYVSFQRGMTTRISQRLEEMKYQNDEALRRAHEERMRSESNVPDMNVANDNDYTARERKAAGITGTALISLKHQLIEQEMKEAGIKISKAQTSVTIRDYHAYSNGIKAGNKVNLSRPIEGSNLAGYLK